MSVKKRTVLLAAAALLAALAILYLLQVARYRAAVDALTVAGVELSRVADGAYTGECDVGLIRARVEVAVEGGVLRGIKLLEHKNDRGAPAERVLEDMLAAQRTDVDAVTGATNSSRVLMKAVENALAGGT